MRNVIFLIVLLLIFSCKKEEDNYSQLILNYKLFSLQANLDSDYVLLSRSQGFKKLKIHLPKNDDNISQSEVDSMKGIESTFALPITKIYKFSQNEKTEIITILKSFKSEDLEGAIEIPQGHCPAFNLVLIKSEGKVYDVEAQCYYTKKQEKLKNLIFDIAIKNEKDSLNLAILNRSKNLRPHE